MKDFNKEACYTHGRTSVYNLNYHFVWGTKYRHDVLIGERGDNLKAILHAIADEYGFTLPYMEIGEGTHIHVFVSAPPTLTVSNLAKWLKGISARKMFVAHPELKTSYWQPEGVRSLWSPSYFVESVGSTNEEAVARYIANQK